MKPRFTIVALIGMLLASQLGAGQPAILRDDVNVVPPGEWRYDVFVLKDQLPATVDCTYVVASPGRARVELMTRDNLQSMLHGGEYESIAQSESGRLVREIGLPGEYAVVVRNQERQREARVALRLSLDFSGRAPVKARYLSPERKLVVVLLSFFGFLGIITISTRKLLIAMRQP